MSGTALPYATCFLALASLSGLLVANGPRWLLRLPLIAATPILALAVWWQLSQRDGWPTGSRPADGSAFVASVVEAPVPGTPGVIYVWAQPPNLDTPRAYRLPYSPELERQVAQAARRSKQGVHVGMRTATRHAKAKHGMQAARSRFVFYRLPPVQVEAKAAAG